MPKREYNIEKTEQTFNAKVNKQSGVRLNNLTTDCWVWTAAKSGGYGWFRDGYAHRWSYEHFNGEIEDGKCIRHKCDNRICVNPEHLCIGTKADNNKDARDRNPKASGKKLADEELPKIVERMKTETLKEIAKDYEMNWRCISRRLKSAKIRPEYTYGAKVSKEMVERMKELRNLNRSYDDIGAELNVSASCVWNYLHKE